jgi:hypothetical protein
MLVLFSCKSVCLCVCDLLCQSLVVIMILVENRTSVCMHADDITGTIFFVALVFGKYLSSDFCIPL